VNLLLSYGTSWLSYFAPIITGFEIFLGFGLLFGAFRKSLSKLSFYFLILLSAVYIWGYFFRDIKDCGCFGEILKLNPAITLLKNALMLSLSWWLWHNSSPVIKKKWLLAIAVVFGLITTSINGFEFKGRINSNLKLSHLNPKTSFIKPYLQSGEQIILIFNPLCGPCRNTSIKLLNSKIPVVALCGNVFSNANYQDYQKAVKPDFPIYAVSIDSVQKHVFAYPTLLYLKDGIVKEVLNDVKL
jgi:thiol-disulfide isomerase/thioredoxin